MSKSNAVHPRPVPTGAASSPDSRSAESAAAASPARSVAEGGLETIRQIESESTRLRLKSEQSTLSPVEVRRWDHLRSESDRFRTDRLERANRLGHHIADVATSRASGAANPVKIKSPVSGPRLQRQIGVDGHLGDTVSRLFVRSRWVIVGLRQVGRQVVYELAPLKIGADRSELDLESRIQVLSSDEQFALGPFRFEDGQLIPVEREAEEEEAPELEDEMEVVGEAADPVDPVHPGPEPPPTKRLGAEETQQIRQILIGDSKSSASGEVQSTLPRDLAGAYRKALVEVMAKTVDKYYKAELQRQKTNPLAEDISRYESIAEAAVTMIQEALGLQGLPFKAPKILPQSQVPGGYDKAAEMLRYLIDDYKDVQVVHKQFGATKDAETEEGIVSAAMGDILSSQEAVGKLVQIDRGWDATEVTGEIRVQTAHSPRQSLEKKHWDHVPVMVHEMLHSMTHPKFIQAANAFPTALGKNTLIEGATDLFKNKVLDYWRGEGRLEKNLPLVLKIHPDERTQVRHAKSKNYESMKQAAQIEHIATVGNLMAAYFFGQVEAIGLDEPSGGGME